MIRHTHINNIIFTNGYNTLVYRVYSGTMDRFNPETQEVETDDYPNLKVHHLQLFWGDAICLFEAKLNDPEDWGDEDDPDDLEFILEWVNNNRTKLLRTFATLYEEKFDIGDLPLLTENELLREPDNDDWERDYRESHDAHYQADAPLPQREVPEVKDDPDDFEGETGSDMH